MKMNYILIVFIFLMSGMISAYAGNDKPVTMEQLPKKAQVFLKTHFGEIKVSLVKMDNEIFDKSYEVFFVNGSKVEFDGKGEWKDIECRYDRVPGGVIPETIATFIRENHPENFIIEIDRDRKDYDVKLDNGMELKFDRRFNFIRYDD